MNISGLKKIDKKEAGITEGRIVHFQVLADDKSGIVICRPGVIVNSWPTASYEHGEVNLTVFTDWSNDRPALSGEPLVWMTSVPHHQPEGLGDRKPGTWHWPEM